MTGTRVLYIRDSIGLGHAARDLAIARELRALNPEVEIMWLAGKPARRLIAEAGETLLPETEAFAHETGVADIERHPDHWRLWDRGTPRCSGSRA